MNIKLTFLIGLEYIKRNQKFILALLLIILCFGFIQFNFKVIDAKMNLRIGLVGTYQEHDIPQDVTKLLSKGLVEASEDGKMRPGLVEGWDVNNDATLFKFKLRKDLKWIDGTPIKAYDIALNFPDTQITILDEKTIQFKLKESYSPFPSLLTKPVFKKGTFLGVGPYRIAKIEKSIIFIPKLTLVSQRQDLPTIYVRFYPSEKVAQTGFNMGEVQLLLGLSNYKFFTNNPQVKIKQKVDFSKIVAILYNFEDPLLGGKNRSLRQALSFIAPEIEGENVANNPYPKTSWVYNPNSKKYLSNVEEAKAALERAKSSIPEDKLKSILTLTATPNLEEVAKKVEATWKNLGFDVKLRIESGIPQNFQALLITQSIPQDPDQYFLWHSSGGKTNLTKYSSVRVDKDLEDGRKSLTDEERKESYFDFQRTILEDAPATFLYFPKYNIVYLKKVEKLLDKILNLQLQTPGVD